MRRRLKVTLAVLAAVALGACGVPIHQHPTVVPKDKVPYHLSKPGERQEP